ncbi:MAG: polymer-forming cytoskeletal protein [Xanthomonadales bacterium]|nr:polymer-forming cytoskeletal protein [Xanthomonadales bacterium]MCB1629013.1 polymer-forming cytoskeletal protein [Xanthomonadales bacterium]MCB1635293.1 polymer-forming cytoskeletal protein [Xanthomonadales bacterium]MCB1642585.1 polymer-forming cytoskeletal protein [Xanthomonadales bacterium]
MFGSGNDSKRAARPSETSTVEGLIGQRMVIDGDVSFTGGLMVEGTVKGSIRAEDGSDAVLVVTPQGRIEGQLHAPKVEVSGTVDGDIVAAERLILGASAKVHGNIYYKVLEMAAGAQVSGQMIFQDEPRRSLPAPGDTRDDE